MVTICRYSNGTHINNDRSSTIVVIKSLFEGQQKTCLERAQLSNLQRRDFFLLKKKKKQKNSDDCIRTRRLSMRCNSREKLSTKCKKLSITKFSLTLRPKFLADSLYLYRKCDIYLFFNLFALVLFVLRRLFKHLF